MTARAGLCIAFAHARPVKRVGYRENMMASDTSTTEQRVDQERAKRAVAAALGAFRKELEGASTVTSNYAEDLLLRNVQHLVPYGDSP